MPFVPGYFRAPYLNVPMLREFPPVHPGVISGLFRNYLRFRQEPLFCVLPEPLSQHLLWCLHPPTSTGCSRAPLFTTTLLCVPGLLRVPDSPVFPRSLHLPALLPHYVQPPYSCTSSTTCVPGTALCLRIVRVSGPSGFPTVPPVFPRSVFHDRSIPGPGTLCTFM
ncbi:hypothetical protein B0H12DRAFT_1243438 [Mycena haematopus]|nr:hypothetical protein B0H12DRAFT_1243438 [Mycena haematopus]